MKLPRTISSKHAAWRAWGAWSLVALLCGLQYGLPAPCDERRRAWITLFAVSLATWFLLLRRRRGIVPVANYHSVSDYPDWLGLPELSIAPAVFDAQLRYLSKAGYQSLFISEVGDILEGTRTAPRRCIALTFDDGYADNWIAVYPLLEKQGMKGTIFVSADFIDRRHQVRPAINRNPAIEDWAGYLTEAEIETMIGSGRIEIQPHGRTHDRCFVSDSIRRFITPWHPNLWLYLQQHPEHKTDWWKQPGLNTACCGHPLFDDGPALANRAYLPDADACLHMLNWTCDQGPAFFDEPGWDRRLHTEWRHYLEHSRDHSRIETDAEFASRVEDELRMSRSVLRERFGVKADILCWPQNEFCEQGEHIARRLGYRATVSNRHKTRNCQAQQSDRIGRFLVVEGPCGLQGARLNLLAFLIRLKFEEGMYLLLPLICLLNKLHKLSVRARRSAGLCQNQLSIWY